MARVSIWTPLFYLGVTAAAIGAGVWLWRKGLPAPKTAPPNEEQLRKDAARRAAEIDDRQIKENQAAEQLRRGEAQARKEAELLAAERRAAEQGVKTRRDGDRVIPLAPILREGARGEEVRKLQEQLGALGFDVGPADSHFGPKTAKALRAFQQARGLPQTGEVDRATEEALAVPPPPPPVPSQSPPAPQDPLLRLAQALRPSLRQAKLSLTRETEWALVVALSVLVDQAPPQVFDAEQRAIRQAAASLEGLGGLLGPVRQALSAQTQAELEAAQAAIAAAYPGAAQAVSRLAVFGLGGAKEQILKNVPPPTSF